MFITGFISYSDMTLNQYKDLIADAHPEALLQAGDQVPSSSVPVEFGPWMLTNSNMSVAFAPGRIDFSKKVISAIDEQEVFVRTAIDIFNKIVTQEQGNGNALRIFRQAFSSVVAYDFTETEDKNSIARKLFVNRDFKGADFYDADLASVLRVNDRLDNKDVAFNYNYHFGFGQKRTKSKDSDAAQVSDCAIMEIDINTATEEKADFSVASVAEFFKGIGQRRKEFAEFIIKGV